MIPNILYLALAALPVLSTPLVRRQQCTGQSCTIADLSGSTGRPYNPTTPPQGGSDAGDCCILTYNPSAAAVLYAEKPALQSECSAPATRLLKRDTLTADEVQAIRQRACSAYTLIYARGTGETAPLGETVGPALASGLQAAAPGKWNIQGVGYDASVDGDNCLGLPGGQVAAQMLEEVVGACPNTKIVMSGYSEGAMVAHDGVAYASKAAAQKVTGVVVFGDPFNGAPIKNYNRSIKTYCAVGDLVCSGEFVITPAHLSYVGADTTDAVAYIQRLVTS